MNIALLLCAYNLVAKAKVQHRISAFLKMSSVKNAFLLLDMHSWKLGNFQRLITEMGKQSKSDEVYTISNKFKLDNFAFHKLIKSISAKMFTERQFNFLSN